MNEILILIGNSRITHILLGILFALALNKFLKDTGVEADFHNQEVYKK